MQHIHFRIHACSCTRRSHAKPSWKSGNPGSQRCRGTRGRALACMPTARQVALVMPAASHLRSSVYTRFETLGAYGLGVDRGPLHSLELPRSELVRPQCNVGCGAMSAIHPPYHDIATPRPTKTAREAGPDFLESQWPMSILCNMPNI